jgi:osmotically-inducible protein OsmY
MNAAAHGLPSGPGERHKPLGGTVTTANLTDADLRMRDAIVRQLEWDPEVDVSGIGVTAIQGTVALTGDIDTYAGKLAAERAAKRVQGVRAVANDLEVRMARDRTDADIAADVTRALQLRAMVPDTVQASVHHGQVTLTGTATSLFQAHEAEEAVRPVRGVRHLSSRILVEPKDANSPDVSDEIC